MESQLFDPFEDIHNLVDEQAWPQDRVDLELRSAPKWETPRQKEIRATIAGRLLFEALSRNMEKRGFMTEPNTSKDPNALNPSKLETFFHEHPEINSIGEFILFTDGLSNQLATQPVQNLELPPMQAEPQVD